jgi:phosphotransacetylase
MATNEKSEPRSVAELIKMDSYQGMTDEEIDALMDFKITLGARALYAQQRADELIKGGVYTDGQEA